MRDELDSALLRELREGDPREWLDWALDALSKRIDEKKTHPRSDELRLAHTDMRETLDGWPKDMYSPRELDDMIARVDAMTHELDNPTPKAKGEGESEKPTTTYSWAPPPSSSSKRKRKRKRKKQSGPQPVPEVKRASVSGDEQKSTKHKDWSGKPSPMPPPKHKRPTPKSQALVLHAVKAIEEEPPATMPSSSVPPSLPTAPKLPVLGPAPSDDKAGDLVIEGYGLEPGSVDPMLAMITDPDGAVAEAHRTLFFRIGATSDATTIMVTTCSSEEDSASCAANLALAIAEANHDVLLLETRLANPRVAKLFDFEPKEGFGRRLARHRRKPEDPWQIANVEDTKLSILAAGANSATAPALDAKGLADVVENLEEKYEYIIVDGPPTYGDSDSRYIVRCVEGVVIAITAGVTRQRDIRRARDILGGVPVLGYVLLER